MKKFLTGMAVLSMALMGGGDAQAQQTASDYCSAGSEAMRSGDYATACNYYERALAKDHSTSVRRLAAQAWIGYARTQSGTRAASCYKRAFDLDPTNTQAKSSLESQLQAATSTAAASRVVQTYGSSRQPTNSPLAGASGGHYEGGYGASGLASPYGSAESGYTRTSSQVANSGQSYRRVVREGSSSYVPEPRSYFLAQNNDPRWNRDAPANDSNCAPTCLAMTCKRFGVYPPGTNANSTPQELILTSRLYMTGTVNEHMGTTPAQMAAGAQQMGFKTQYVDTVNDVDRALDRGAVCSIGGCPWVPHSYGPRYHGRNYPEFHNGHAILVVGKQGGYFIVSDPLYFDGPINVSSAELEAFLQFHDGSNKGVAMSP